MGTYVMSVTQSIEVAGPCRLVLNEAHARRLLREYQRYYNASRTHLSPGKDTPERREVQGPERGARVIELREVFGLHRRYERRAA
ncbi:hypothetical protein [Myxococcus sp. AB036A]|uniref:hypothetical protein n=1 Tax=Myxococcus sp. AB036A TaxID=2562793 RepID=UPI001E4E2B96|nr:hypothetical protein [Myxococcus sp. AB036A]